MNIDRKSAAEVRQAMSNGELLVATYTAQVFPKYAIEGAIDFDEFRRIEATLDRNTEIFFY